MNLIKTKSSPNHYNGRLGWKADLIVFHQTGGSELAPALNWYLNPNSQCSPNWVINTNGDIYELVSPDNAAYCNGTTVKDGALCYKKATSPIVRSRAANANYYTYSMECVHCAHGDITAEQVTAIIELIQNIIIPHMKKNGVVPQIDRKHLIGHCEINPATRSFCPGKNFPYDEIISRLNGKSDTENDDYTVKSVKYIMKSYGIAAVRTAPSKSGGLIDRVSKGGYYAIDEIIVRDSEIWLKHKDEKTYSMYKDGGQLFGRIGTYREARTAAKVNVRKQASLTGNKITVLLRNTPVLIFDGETVSADNYVWQKVLINNDVGYIAKKYLEEK